MENKPILPSVGRIYSIQAAVVTITALVLVLVDKHQIVAFLAGAGLISLNFVLLERLWRGVLDKKPVARTLIIVVVKYTILGALLYVFVRKWNLPLIPLFVGISTLGVSFLIAALQVQLLDKSK